MNGRLRCQGRNNYKVVWAQRQKGDADGILEFMAKYGIWEIIGLIATAIPTILVLCYIFPRNAIKNLYIDTDRVSINSGYPKAVRIKV